MGSQKGYLYLNGYRMIYLPEHPRAYRSSGYNGYIYEHIVVAEDFMRRPLRSGEVVHHLDLCRDNNHPSNLLVLENSQHSKLHGWIGKGMPGIASPPIPGNYCKLCNRPLARDQSAFCSSNCEQTGRGQKSSKPPKEKLLELQKTHSREGIGREYGVSGNAVKKWEKSYGIFKARRKS